MAHSTPGRHRAHARHNPVSELSVIASRAGATGAKATAVLAASGGLVAAFALPAAATPDLGVKVTATTPEAPAAVAAAPAISAPAASGPATVEAVGVTGVTVVAKPKPKPKPKLEPVVAPQEQTRESQLVTRAESADRPSGSTSRTQTSASRSTARTAPARTAPAPAPAAPARQTNDNVAQSASGIVNIARGLLGIAYVYGGSTPAGFDCSGLTQYVYGKAGISIPRTASAQQRAATPVSNPRPGDLVFYGTPAWHVGIFTGGDMMIDSPKPGKYSSERNMFGTPTGFGRF